MKIWLTRIVLHNLCGHEHIEFSAGGINVLSGRNGSGKSGFLKSVRNVFAGGAAGHLLRDPREPGWAIIDMSDGFTARKDISPADPGPSDTKLLLTHPDSGPVSRSATYLKGLVDDLGVDPLALDRCRPQDRAAYLQKILSVSVTEAELSEAAGRPIKMVGEGFAAIAQADKFLYDERTGENRVVRTSEEANEKLAETVIPLHDVSELPTLKAEKEALNKATAEQRFAITREEEIEKRQQEQVRAESLAQAAAKLAEAEAWAETLYRNAVAAAEKARSDAKARAQEEAANTKSEALSLELKQKESISRAARGALADLEAATFPKLADLSEKITRAEILAEENKRVQKTRELIEQNRRQADIAANASAALTRGIENLEKLRLKKLAELPVKELEIRDGEVWGQGIDGRFMPWEQLNTARRYELSLVAEAARSGPLALQIVDNVESIDAEAWPEFLERCKARGLQVFMARVTPGDFNIEADPEVLS